MPPKKAASATPAVHLRRMYVDCRYGQLHLRTAFAGNGGFDELTPLVCVPPATMTGQVFDGLLRRMGTDRTVYAPDIPGSGGSDPASPRATDEDHAAALGDFLDQLRLRCVDLLGYHAGTGIAAELAIARPRQVRRVVLVGVPSSAQAGRLPQVTQPLLVLRLQDDQREATARARALLPDARFVDLPDHGSGALEAAPDVVAGEVRDFLDAPRPGGSG